MLSISKRFLSVVVALGFVLGVSAVSARAEDAKDAGKGSISGTVVDKDGKAVAGVEVHLMKPRQRGPGGGGGGGQAPAAKGSLGNEAVRLQRQPPPSIATATTDADGKFTMKDVPVGDYMIGVRDPDKKVFGRSSVKVEADKAATVEIKCSDTPPARGGGGGGGAKQ